MYRKTVILLLLTAIFCNSNAQKYAKEFLNNQRTDGKREIIYFSPAKTLIRTDINILDSIDDEKLLEVFNGELTKQMKFLGFEVIETSSDQNNKEYKSNEHTFEVIQLEAEEFSFYEAIDVSEDSSKHNVIYKRLNGIRINAWFDIDAAKNGKNTIVFNDNQITEEIIDPATETVNDTAFLIYDLYPVNPNDAYTAAFYNANTSATYFFNYLMNNYVAAKSDKSDKNHYGISPYRELITKKNAFDCFEIQEN